MCLLQTDLSPLRRDAVQAQDCPDGPDSPGQYVCFVCTHTQNKKTLNRCKSCTFSQVAGQKPTRPGSRHHRFQVKPPSVQICPDLFLFVFGLKLPVLSEIWECRHVSVSACWESCSRQTNSRPLGAGFSLPRLAPPLLTAGSSVSGYTSPKGARMAWKRPISPTGEPEPTETLSPLPLFLPQLSSRQA